MKPGLAFWDASAIVPLCIHEATSRQARLRLRQFSPVVWWGTLVEVSSAICRLQRAGEISTIGAQGAHARLTLLGQSWREILPTDEVRGLALQSLDDFSLRAADSFQFAAALVWCQQRPARRHFVCADRRLALAAKAAGFVTLELSTTAS